jgi:alcohol dehydrogenase (NADP+)
MPLLGLGTWKAAGGEVGAAVQNALNLGYRHLDCASVYGNEAEIGAALKLALSSGVVQRQDLWITSKLWNDCHSPEEVRPALERSLNDLGLEELDLYLIHWPVAQHRGVVMPERAEELIPLEQLPLSDTWGAMEELVEAGLVRHIGVSNFTQRHLNELLPHCRLRPAVNQVERHPWLRQLELLEFCGREAIHITAYSPLGSAASGQTSPLLQDPEVRAIAAEQGCTEAQVLLAWAIACGTSVIPKSVQPSRLAANLAAAQLQLSTSELQRLDALDRQHRFVDGSFWDVPGGPYSRDTLWGTATSRS